MIRNDYFHIAMNDLDYLNAVKDLPFYNQHCISCQQIGEKLLKHIIYLTYSDVDKEKILKTHSLRTIYRAICKVIPSFNLPEEELANLTDYYFDAKYPGNDFFTANEEDFLKCYSSLMKIVDEVNRVINS
ncbi:MAG: HEPN domain-containing protein [Clostridiales bacterium]|nr:HEPN domain-containing protein [Clostridiales bacterium]